MIGATLFFTVVITFIGGVGLILLQDEPLE